MRWIFLFFALLTLGGVRAESDGHATAFTTRRVRDDGKLVETTKVEVRRPDAPLASYDRTNRGLKELKDEQFYPSELLDAGRLLGKKVLDIGTGGGKFVSDLRAAGVDAYGIDIKLPDQAKLSPYLSERDARKTGFPAEEFDIAYSSISLFYYEDGNRKLMRDSLVEITRILKKGGKLRLAPVFATKLLPVIAEIPSLKLVRSGMSRGWAETSWIELEKID